MPANTDPIFTKSIQVSLAGAVIGPSANTSTDGTGANSTLIFTADSTNGSYVHKVILKAIGTTAATVARVFYCSDIGTFTAGTTNTASNSTMVAEFGLLSWTASNTAASPQIEIPINISIPASTKLFITFGTSTGASGNGYNPLVIAGGY